MPPIRPYMVMVSAPDINRGVGPAKIYAETEEDAKASFAKKELKTVAELEQDGLTFWTVRELETE